ncbi:MAG: sodium:calcium antiporter [Clostridiales bacterium]|nr:sodium:calcium antiporter [Eubacteriales bacterium]MDH7565826.1 sodium:calcium antiporter [Clostridiales bacterium]
MWIDIIKLILSLGIILLSCELFTNGIEWLGKKMKVGDGVVGSIFSAVGTCLPETMIPIIAILFSGNSSSSTDIGIGAIAGAPFMLSTLAFFITGISVLIFWKRRGTGMEMKLNNKILSRDIGFFILVYSLGIAASFTGAGTVKAFVALVLVAAYVYYIFLTVKHDHESHGHLESLYIVKYLNLKTNMATILFQIALALTGIILGAEFFVENIKDISSLLGVSTLILSLIITPIATELPEKFNSIIWISKKKDTLALGNITGAMVFQSCIPVFIGILATPWVLDEKVVVSAVLALLSALTSYLWIRLRGKLNPIPLLMGGAFYAIFIGYLVIRGF